LASRLTEKVKAEIGQDLAAYNAYIEKHGSPAEMLRDYLAERDDAASGFSQSAGSRSRWADD
jgi:hypothetical protein